MLKISEFLKRIGGIQGHEIAFRSGVQAAIKDITGAEVPIGSIIFKSGTIMLKGISSSARTAIFIKKAVIIERANSNQSTHTIKDIR